MDTQVLEPKIIIIIIIPESNLPILTFTYTISISKTV